MIFICNFNYFSASFPKTNFPNNIEKVSMKKNKGKKTFQYKYNINI